MPTEELYGNYNYFNRLPKPQLKNPAQDAVNAVQLQTRGFTKGAAKNVVQSQKIQGVAPRDAGVLPTTVEFPNMILGAREAGSGMATG